MDEPAILDKRLKRRFQVEELDNGILVKISEANADKLIGRYAFPNVEQMLDWLEERLTT